mmetsp:Transcript_8781/g.18599  ORF Transcript_8781/g.18599 Transcript_8781/m.18599 type:complete len:94 (+) Transcript_8781:325-606(+)
MEKEEHDEMSRVDDCTNKCCRHRAASPHSQKEQRLLPLLHSWTYSDSFFFFRGHSKGIKLIFSTLNPSKDETLSLMFSPHCDAMNNKNAATTH